MDIKPPPKRPRPPQKPAEPIQPVLPQPEAAPLPLGTKRFWRKRNIGLALACAGALLLAGSVSTAVWYNWAIGPRSDSSHKVRVVVESGETAASIADTLYDHDLIHSRFAFGLYTQLSGSRSKLQAGGYVFSANQSVASIVEHMVNGKTDEFNITIPPGLTLDELRTQFKKDGFTDDEITSAFNATYTNPVLTTRPAGATLEGYIFPETYRMNADQSLNDLLTRSFDQMYKVMQDGKYLDEFAKRGLTIHQAVTLASIVQKEVKGSADQKQVAQVFLKRLSSGMQLGSDVTYMYAAKQLGVDASPSLDSPYNTRKYAGLPPGPIANMNPSALEAVAFPAPGDYLYFVAGDGADEGRTFFATTEAEHNANVAAHCHTLCQ